MCGGQHCSCGCSNPFGLLTPAGVERLQRYALTNHVPLRRAACGHISGTCRCGASRASARAAPPAQVPVCLSCCCLTPRADGRVRIRGRAAQFWTWSSTILGEMGGHGFRELLMPNCFEEALRKPDVAILVGHNSDWELAHFRNQPGDTARVWTTDEGLFFEFDMPPTALGHRTLAGLTSGQLNGCSFAFTGATAAWRELPGGELGRIISAVAALNDVSVVSRGAYSVSAPPPGMAA